MLRKLEIYEIGEDMPIITLTENTYKDETIDTKGYDFDGDGKISVATGENFTTIEIIGNILLGHIQENVNTPAKTKLEQEARDVTKLINWALLPGDDERCYKKIIITGIDDEGYEEIDRLVIPMAYVSYYTENYNLLFGKKED